MNWNQIEGNWDQLKGTIQQQWARFIEDEMAEDSEGDAYSDSNTEHTNKFGCEDTVINKSVSDKSVHSLLGMQDGSGGKGKDSEGPDGGEGMPGSGESDEMDDSGKPIPNPMPDNSDEPEHTETPHQEKSLDQT
jgi:hypothetical protein